MTIIRVEKYFRNLKGYLNFQKQKIEDLKTFLKELSIQQYASISYFPLVGWVFPLVMRKDNPICQRHLKQGFVISMLFLLVNVFLNIVNIFTPSELRFFRFGLVIFIYFFNILYIIFCLIAIRMVLKGRIFNIDILKRFMDLIQL